MSRRPNVEPSKVAFQLKSDFSPLGDQPKAIESLVTNLNHGLLFQTLKGVTGSGKTFTIANVIQQVQRPALIIAPNKTLAAQLYNEFREFFPENKVRYFVSYYDYYQPEAYVPSTDTFIEKDAAINEEIDKLRHSATRALLEFSDTIVVASVSCIYGLGAPEEYFKMMLFAEQGQKISREQVIEKLVGMQYKRSEVEFMRGSFRVRGDTIDVLPSDESDKAIRIVFFGNEIEEIREIDAISGSLIKKLTTCAVYPVSHYVTNREAVLKAVIRIRKELKERLSELKQVGKVLEAQRLEQRTNYDIELLTEIGFCPGIENYSRHLDGREEGEPPTTLLDYFTSDFLLIVDESHVTTSQIGAMFRGDRSRKSTLVEYGFRLPSALDNRPLNMDEFWQRVGQTIFVSATPAQGELDFSDGAVVEQINRPTGLLDPPVEVRPAGNQVDDLHLQIQATVKNGDRVLVTTLTKRMAEDLAEYLRENGVSCRYLHSDIETIERVEILRGLRRGDFDVLIGINLLREGLDLIEVGLVAILDADKEGFLRSEKSLIQTMGRAARNIRGRVIMYADKVTNSMNLAIEEANRRRDIQRAYNTKHGIVPRSAQSRMATSLIPDATIADVAILDSIAEDKSPYGLLEKEGLQVPKDPQDGLKLIEQLKKEMYLSASKREYEKAAQLRDRISLLQKIYLS